VGTGNLNGRLLHNLTRDRIFQALAGLDKSGDRRKPAGRPTRLAPKERTLAVGDEHDDRRIEARKKFASTDLVRATDDMSCTLRNCRLTTDTAETMASSPDYERSRIRQQSGFVPPQKRRERPQLFERRALRQLHGTLGLDVDEHTPCAPEPPEQYELPRVGVEDNRVVIGQELDARLAPRSHELCSAFPHHIQRRRVHTGGLQPSGLLTRFGTPINIRASKEVWPCGIHERILTKGRCGRV